MKILLVSATKFEIAPLFNALGLPVLENEHLTKFRSKQHEIDILITGVGMVFTTFQLGKLLAKEKYDVVRTAAVKLNTISIK